MLDNYATHKHPGVKAWLKDHEKFALHFVPTSFSWLNFLERFFAKNADEVIRGGALVPVAELKDTVYRYFGANKRIPNLSVDRIH